MNSTWTSGKTQLSVGILKTMLVTKVNYDEIVLSVLKYFWQRKTSLRKLTTLKNTAALLLLIVEIRMTTV
jgi:hypothetical protein